MDEPINRAARTHEESVEDWRFAEVSKTLYRFYDLINDRFFNGKIPTPVISFKHTRSEGHYVVGRNEIGVRENINIDAAHLRDPLAEVLATLVHEMVHGHQENYGTPGKRNYHNKQCREKMEEIGIPCDAWGHGLGICDPFVGFLRQHGVVAETRLELPETRQRKVARSRLKKWTCGCTKVWATVDVHAQCTACGRAFVCV